MGAYFPLFVDLSEKEVLVVGAGRIASRRIQTLCSFTKHITVIAPEASDAVLALAQQGVLRLVLRSFIPGEIAAETYLVLAATDSGEVNRAIWRECREKQILVNVCSEKELCDFYFPGVVMRDQVVVGVTAGGRDHRQARQVTERLRKALEETGKD